MAGKRPKSLVKSERKKGESLAPFLQIQSDIGTEQRKMAWKKAKLVPYALQSSLVTRPCHILLFPGH